MKVLFLTNYAAPYKVQFFDELGKHMELTVLFSGAEEARTRAAEWFVNGEGGFQKVFLEKKAGSLGGEHLCLDVIHWLKKGYDRIVIGGYSSPTAMLAMAWLRMKRIPFYIEVDGGLIRQDSALKYRFKKMLVSSADWWISSGKYPTKYLVHYGAREENIYEYPFTSLWERDIAKAVPSEEQKMQLRRELGMEEEKIVLYAGRFLPEKGMDALLEAAPALDQTAGVYFVGGEPKQEHLRFCQEKSLTKVHFVGFQKKDALARYYKAADVFVLPTKSDVWGLVINEAMACGLPVVTTDQCAAGLELIQDGVNGYIVPVNDNVALAEKINAVLGGDCRGMGAAALEKIRPYTLENMVKAHVDILNDRR